MFKLNGKLKACLVIGLVTAMSMGFSINAFADSANVVTLGANLSKQQKEQALNHFGVKTNEVQILEINNKEERKYLEGVISDAQIGNITISCSYVELLPKGSGLDIETENLTYVTEGMIKNALITSGITDAKIKAYAPFKVSGTGALTGILKGFSDTEVEISEEQKEVANEEMIITGQLGEIVGNDVAIGIVNDIKAEVIENKPQTNIQIGNIINNVTNNYNVELNDEQIEELTALMKKIDKLDLDFEALKESLNSIGDKIKESLGITEETGGIQGFFERIGDWFSNLWENIKNFFNGLFNKDDVNIEDEPTQEVENNEEEPVIDEETNTENNTKEPIEEEVTETENNEDIETNDNLNNDELEDETLTNEQ